MIVTEFGIVTLVNDLQLPKACAPMIVTEFGIVTLINDMQSENA